MKKALKRFEIIRTLTAVFIALLVGFAIILILSNEPLTSLQTFIIGPLTRVRYMGNVVEAMIPLIFSGLAVSLLFLTRQFNLGAEGIFYFSGLMAAVVGFSISLPVVIHPFVAILFGSIIGALLMSSIGYFKAKYDTSELVLSLMMNAILYGIGLFLLNHYFREVRTVVLKSVELLETSRLGTLVPGTRIHFGLIIAIIAVLFCHWLVNRSKLGYEIRMTGANESFATYSGINVKKTIIIVSLISGFLAGMGGSIEILGMYDSFKWTALPGLGFDGALIAMLSKNQPKNVAISALFLAYVRIGADLMSRLTDVPAEMVGIMQGLILLLISGQKFLQFYRQRLIVKEAQGQ